MPCTKPANPPGPRPPHAPLWGACSIWPPAPRAQRSMLSRAWRAFVPVPCPAPCPALDACPLPATGMLSLGSLPPASRPFVPAPCPPRCAPALPRVDPRLRRIIALIHRPLPCPLPPPEPAPSCAPCPPPCAPPSPAAAPAARPRRGGAPDPPAPADRWPPSPPAAWLVDSLSVGGPYSATKRSPPKKSCLTSRIDR